MIYLWIFILFLIILRRPSSQVSEKVKKWGNVLLIACGLISIGIVIYAYYSANHWFVIQVNFFNSNYVKTKKQITPREDLFFYLLKHSQYNH